MSTLARLGLLGSAGVLALGFPHFKQALTKHTPLQAPTSGWILLVTFCFVVCAAFAQPLQTAIRFVWSCFLAPLPKSSTQQGRLDAFYQAQADM